jgi:hypothetical protein
LRPNHLAIPRGQSIKENEEEKLQRDLEIVFCRRRGFRFEAALQGSLGAAQNFGLKTKFWSENKILASKQNFGLKTKFWPENKILA